MNGSRKAGEMLGDRDRVHDRAGRGHRTAGQVHVVLVGLIVYVLLSKQN